MLNPRLLKRWLAGWLTVAMLFTQLASAAYVCPQMSMQGQPCAEMMAQGVALDAEQPGLCQQHCQVGGSLQAADHATPGAFAMVALLLFVLLPTAIDRAGVLVRLTHQRRRDRAPPPPHSILHCCHRI